MIYSHFEHRHRFAVWAAARAAQRAFTSVDNLRDALESTDIQAFLMSPSAVDTGSREYEDLHSRWGREICGNLSDRGVRNATFGRAAKLIAVYMKAMVVIGPHAESTLAAVAYPPIDRNLLQNIARDPSFPLGLRSVCRATAWTKLNEDEYYALVAQLRQVIGENEPWWKLEKYWTVTDT